MFNPTQLAIDAFVDNLKTTYVRTYGLLEPAYPGILEFIARMALENIANSDAPYHDVNHTIMVTLVGQEILRSKHISEGGVRPREWLHFMVSLLCHDIGYVRGVCGGDGRYVINLSGETIELPPGSTDAGLTPYHVTRSKLFIRQRFGKGTLVDIDAKIIEDNIERTRFPVPADDEHAGTSDYPGLVRAADLTGQLSDVSYLRKVPALFREFQETGMAERLGYRTADDLRNAYPRFSGKSCVRSSATPSNTFLSPRTANSGLPTFMPMSSRSSITACWDNTYPGHKSRDGEFRERNFPQKRRTRRATPQLEDNELSTKHVIDWHGRCACADDPEIDLHRNVRAT